MATHPENASRRPPIKLAGVVFLVLVALVAALVYAQWRGKLTPKTNLTMVSDRAGLVMDPGSKVTYNGVEIGRVKTVSALNRDGKQMAQLNLEVQPRFVDLIPANVDAQIKASTVFGNKYVSFTSPKNPTKTRISSADVIDASHVTTEFNTLFETLTSISEKVDPVKLNLTLSAAAEVLNGLGTWSSTTSTRRCRSSGRTSSSWRTWPTSTPRPAPTSGASWTTP
jgi:phospholipid/cholesterol/gamma-HCH transport system substrate-binding protein